MVAMGSVGTKSLTSQMEVSRRFEDPSGSILLQLSRKHENENSQGSVAHCSIKKALSYRICKGSK